MTLEPEMAFDAPDFRHMLVEPPFIAGHLPGIGGAIKATAEHFQVEEILPYPPCGAGEHVFVKLRRAGWNTTEAGAALGKIFELKGSDIGWGGRKDKNAVTTQTFSLRLPMDLSLAAVETRLRSLPFDIIELQRHTNKLKTGHVAANRFRIVVSGVEPHVDARAAAIAAVLKSNGIPNYYGEQRFGHHFRNLDRAAALVRRGKAYGKKEAFTVSVLQSALFNCWLIERIRRGKFRTLLQGDVVRKTDTGGLFVVDDLQEALQRFEAGRIIYTGPIYGYKMMAATGPAGDHEKELLKRFALAPSLFKPLRATGSRRSAIIHLHDLAIQPVPQGLEFTFTLPAGAYATTVLREFTRPPEQTGPDRNGKGMPLP
jgi:tRNA pseudouridine13 synthase